LVVVIPKEEIFEHNEKLGSDDNIKTIEENKIKHLSQRPSPLFSTKIVWLLNLYHII